MRLGHFIRGAEGFFNNAAVDNILNLGSYKRRAFSGLNVLELKYLINASVIFKCYSVSEISC